MSFKAKGEGANLKITLVKYSIKNFAEQYSYSIPLSKTLTDYTINLDEFTGIDPLEKIHANDVTTVVFAFENSTGLTTTIDGAVADIFFSKKSKEYVENIKQQKIHLFPNPATGGKFNATFRSDTESTYTLRIFNTSSGKTIFSKVIQSIKGDNVIPVQLNSKPAAGIYTISIEKAGMRYGSNQLILN